MAVALQFAAAIILPLLIVASIRALFDMARDGTENVRHHRLQQDELAAFRKGLRATSGHRQEGRA